MKLGELVERYERRRAEAARHGSTAPLAKVYAVVLEELRGVDGVPDQARLMTTAEAAEVLGLSEKTVRRWLADDRFPGARKTSGERGEWRIPSAEVYAAAGREGGARASVPRLWEPSE